MISTRSGHQKMKTAWGLCFCMTLHIPSRFYGCIQKIQHHVGNHQQTSFIVTAHMCINISSRLTRICSLIDRLSQRESHRVSHSVPPCTVRWAVPNQWRSLGTAELGGRSPGYHAELLLRTAYIQVSLHGSWLWISLGETVRFSRILMILRIIQLWFIILRIQHWFIIMPWEAAPWISLLFLCAKKINRIR